MKTFGLIGEKLIHSFSKGYFENKFIKEGIEDCEYSQFELATIQEFPSLINSIPQFGGLNVTIPYKEAVITYLDDLDESAKRVGAVNVIHRAGGKLIGYNTDYLGFQQSLSGWLDSQIHSALVLGSGGAAKAVVVALNDMGIASKIVSRSGKSDLTYDDLREKESIISNHHLIVNTTPLGTFPNIEAKPDINYAAMTSEHYLYDLVYNPEETAFMTAGIKNGAHVKNGLSMLINQAELSWQIWNR